MPASYIIKGPPPLIDGHRAFRERRQLTDRDLWILDQYQRHGVRICHENGETDFRCNGVKMPRQAVLRLLQLKHLIVDEDGLFPGMGQTLLVNTTPLTDACGATHSAEATR